jgi:hypothetical protein
MQLTVRRPHALTAAFRHASHPAPAAPAAPTEDRARRAGGPEDHALYSCSCGFAFKARVTTSVGCPSCGLTQAW